MTKNNDGRLDHCDPIPDFIKSGIYRVFNFIFLFLFFCTGAVFASGSYASNTILSINAEKKSIAEVLNVIENKSEYHFFYNSKLVNVDRKVTLAVDNKDIFTVLDILFKNSNIAYKVVDKDIILTESAIPSKNEKYQANKRITGIIKDQTGEPVIGANVVLKGDNGTGTITDINGRYSLDVPENAVLIISYIGYTSIEIPVKGQSEIDVTLKEDSQAIEEVVVVGYGTQKKVNLVGAVAAVNIDEKISSRSISNVSSGLSGLVPGLQVSQTTSMAGNDNASLMIRGMGTVNNTSPLVVVDGMPDVDINRINMADVESISVLKDAASASIYGSRAANGVILITTRTGKKGKTSINFTGSYAIEKPSRSYDFMDDYPRALTLQQFRAASGTKRESYNFKDGTIDQWMALGMIDPLRYPNTDWFDTFMRTGTLQNYTLSATGGNDKSNFYISIGMMDKEGIQMKNDFKRYNTRFNYDYNMFNNVKVGARFDGNWSEFTYSGYADGITNNDTSDSGGGDMQYAVAGVTPYDPVTGRYGGVMAYGEDIQAYNPYAFFDSRNPKQTRQQLNGSIYLDWNVFKGFTAHVDYALAALAAAGLLAKEVGIVHGALACYLFDYDHPLCTGANSVVIGAAMGAEVALELLHLIAIGLHEFIAGLMRSCAGAALLTLMGLEEKVETDYHVVGAGGAGLVKEQLFLKVALGGAELVGLHAVHIHAGHHEIYAGESVGDTLAQYAQHLGGDGDYVHYGVGPAVVIPGLDDLNIYLFDDILVFLHELIQKLTAYGHLAVKDVKLIVNRQIHAVDKFSVNVNLGNTRALFERKSDCERNKHDYRNDNQNVSDLENVFEIQFVFVCSLFAHLS